MGGKNLPGGYRREVVEAGGLKLHKSVNLGVFAGGGEGWARELLSNEKIQSLGAGRCT